METERTITITGEGIATARPDLAEITIGVRINAPTLLEAANNADNDMRRVMRALRDQGVSDTDLQTTRVNVFASQRYEGSPSEGRTITEYGATNGVRVTVRDLSTLGRILGAVVSAGAGEVFGLTFRLNDPEPLARQARTAAMNDAKARATEYAQQAGASLGEVRQISEQHFGMIGGTGVGPYGGGLLSLGGGSGTVGLAAAETPVESGEITTRASVHVVWALV